MGIVLGVNCPGWEMSRLKMVTKNLQPGHLKSAAKYCFPVWQDVAILKLMGEFARSPAKVLGLNSTYARFRQLLCAQKWPPRESGDDLCIKNSLPETPVTIFAQKWPFGDNFCSKMVSRRQFVLKNGIPETPATICVKNGIPETPGTICAQNNCMFR